MDRFGIFVDAGYLIAAGGDCCFKVVQRNEIIVNFEKIVVSLMQLGKDMSGLDHLRTYWYDAATNREPTRAHLVVARLASVKLRLGQLTSGGQKGVDSLIVRDLITLAHQRAIATGILLGGDEDLREGMREAQDYGVKMILLGIESSRPSVSESLWQEADAVSMLDRSFLEAHFSLRKELGPLERGREPGEIGKEFGREWVLAASPEDQTRCQKERPNLPRELDGELLARGRRFVANPLAEEQKRELRLGFWRGFDSTN